MGHKKSKLLVLTQLLDRPSKRSLAGSMPISRCKSKISSFLMLFVSKMLRCVTACCQMGQGKNYTPPEDPEDADEDRPDEPEPFVPWCKIDLEAAAIYILHHLTGKVQQ